MCHQYYCSPLQQVLMCNFILLTLWVFEVFLLSFWTKWKLPPWQQFVALKQLQSFAEVSTVQTGTTWNFLPQQASASTWNNYSSSTVGPLLCTVNIWLWCEDASTAPCWKGPYTHAHDCADLWYSTHLPQQLICSKAINLNLILLTAKGEILL